MLRLQDNQQRVDVVLVQETHWKTEGSRSFNSGPWQVLTAGAGPKDKNAGLALQLRSDTLSQYLAKRFGNWMSKTYWSQALRSMRVFVRLIQPNHE